MKINIILNITRLVLLFTYYLTFYIPMYTGLAVYEMNAGSLFMGVFLVLILLTVFTMFFKEDLLNVVITTLLAFILFFLLLIFSGKLPEESFGIAFYLQIVLFMFIIFAFAFTDQSLDLIRKIQDRINGISNEVEIDHHYKTLDEEIKEETNTDKF
ncbi:MAG: hypothetical protein QM489_05160 [Candidatus Izemoplasma sp.]